MRKSKHIMAGGVLLCLAAHPSVAQERALGASAICNSGDTGHDARACLEIVLPSSERAGAMQTARPDSGKKVLQGERGDGSGHVGIRIPADTEEGVQVKKSVQAPGRIAPTEQRSIRIRNSKTEEVIPSPDKQHETMPSVQPQTPSPRRIAEHIRRGNVLRLHSVQFDYDSARVKPKAKEVLQLVAGALSSDPELKVIIEGHTDARGEKRYNLKLSQRRAEAVKKALVEWFRIDPARLRTKGYGESRPLASNDTSTGRALNRRVEIRKWK